MTTNIDTTGGTSIGGNAAAQRDFVGRDQNVSVFAGLTHSEMLSLRLVQKFERLYGLLKPLARFGREGVFTSGHVHALVETLEQWYFDEAGGMYLRFSPQCYQAYTALQESLARVHPAALNGDFSKLIELEQFESCRQLGSHLRHALSDYVAQAIVEDLHPSHRNDAPPDSSIIRH